MVDMARTVSADYPSDVVFLPSEYEATECEGTEAGETENTDPDEREDVLRMIEEITRDLFEVAMGEKEEGKGANVWLAFLQVRNAQTYGFPYYEEIRQRLVEYISQELSGSS